jgi:hypothetical protein
MNRELESVVFLIVWQAKKSTLKNTGATVIMILAVTLVVRSFSDLISSATLLKSLYDLMIPKIR